MLKILNPLLLSVLAMVITASARAESRPITQLRLDPEPTSDAQLDAGVLPGSHVLNGRADERPDIIAPTRITGFKSGDAWIDALEGPVDAHVSQTLPMGIAPPDHDRVRNYWGAQGMEADGAASLTGLDISVGVDNAVSADIIFSTAIVGAEGAANDFLLTDLFGDDSLRVIPLDQHGAALGPGFIIESGPGPNNIATTDPGMWGWTGIDLAVAIENLPDTLFGQPAGEGSVFDNLRLAAVAFDIEDLFGDSEKIVPVYGLRIIGLELGSGKGSFDLGVAAVNKAAFKK